MRTVRPLEGHCWRPALAAATGLEKVVKQKMHAGQDNLAYIDIAPCGQCGARAQCGIQRTCGHPWGVHRAGRLVGIVLHRHPGHLCPLNRVPVRVFPRNALRASVALVFGLRAPSQETTAAAENGNRSRLGCMAVAMSGLVAAIIAALQSPRVVEAIVKVVAGARTGREDLASKADVGALQADVASLKTDLKADTPALKAELAHLKTELAAVKADLKLLKFGYGPVILALLIKLAFFP